MSHRQVVLDTETTGMRVDQGHRIIEVGCVELVDRRLTGNVYHQYINPEREVEAGAFAVHGISDEFLSDKPLFKHISKELMSFLDGAELIIHNAPFDVGFLNHELLLARQGWKNVEHYCAVLDTLLLARKIHVGQRNNLDALCKRYYVDNTKREYHGALLDAHLLAQVYLAMTGGQGTFFDESKDDNIDSSNRQQSVVMVDRHHLVVLKASPDELKSHEQYLDMLEKKGNCVWRK